MPSVHAAMNIGTWIHDVPRGMVFIMGGGLGRQSEEQTMQEQHWCRQNGYRRSSGIGGERCAAGEGA